MNTFLRLYQLAPLAFFALAIPFAGVLLRLGKRAVPQWMVGFWLALSAYLPARLMLLLYQPWFIDQSTTRSAMPAFALTCVLLGAVLLAIRRPVTTVLLPPALRGFDEEKAHLLSGGVSSGLAALAFYFWLYPLLVFLCL